MNTHEHKNILLVDDEVIIAMDEAETIGRFGYSVVLAHSGEDAVKTATENDDIDLVLMDIDMGKGPDGTEAARRILAKKNVPIVFLTSHSEREMVERVQGITRYGYVIKNSGDFVLRSSIEMAFELFGAHEKSRQSEARMRTLVNTIPDLVWLKDTEGVYLSCNWMFERLYGAKEADIIGKTDYDFVDEDLADFFREHDRRAMEAGGPGSNEEWLTFADDGHRALMETIKTPLIDENGMLIGVLGIARDITGRKRIEDALLDSETKYRSLVEMSLVGVYIIQDKLFKFVNKRYCEMIGYAYEELVDSINPIEITHPEDRSMVEENIRKRIHGEIDSIEYELRGIKKDGGLIYLRVLGRVMNYQGRPAIMGTVIDVTDRRRAEEALQKKVLALSQPLDDPAGIQFTDLFNLEEIQRIQDEFAAATNVASIITHPDGTPITRQSNFCRLCNEIIRKTEKGLQNCYRSDAVIGRQNPGGPVVQPCLSGGLWDAGASITLGGRHIANWLIGQIRNEELDEERMLEYADVIGADRGEFRKALTEVPVMSREQFDKVARALFSLANEMSLKAYQNIQQARFIMAHQKAEEASKESETLFRSLADSGMALIWTADINKKCDYLNQPWLSFTGRTLEQELGDGWTEGVHPDDLARCMKIYTEAFDRREPFSMDYRLRHHDGEYRWIQDDGSPRFNSRGEFIGYIGHCLDITCHKQAEEKIQSLLEEKELLLQEVHHRVKNNMNTIMSLLNLQSYALKNQEAVLALQDARNRVQSMAVLYDKLFRSADFRKISIREYIASLVDEIIGGFPNSASVKIEKKLDDIVLDVKTLFHLGIIINELLTNAMKHAFNGRKSQLIRISATLKDGRVRIVIQDNGLGLPESVDIESSPGFGFRLVGMLSTQIGGRMRIERGEGTRFILEFDV